MFQDEFFFEFLNGLAGFNRSGTGQAANQEFAGLDAILEVQVGLHKCFLLHANIIARI